MTDRITHMITESVTDRITHLMTESVTDSLTYVLLYYIRYYITIIVITYNIYVTMYYLLQVVLRCLAKEGGVLVQYNTTQQPRGARIIGNTGQKI